MAMNIFRKFAFPARTKITKNASLRFWSSIYEPDYLEAMKPPYPIYPPLLVRIRGYEYPVLEDYQSWIHRIATHMGFDVVNSFPMPAKELKVLRFKSGTMAVETEYLLKIYERDLKVENVNSVKLPIFLWAVKKAIPVGAMLDIEEWTYEKEKYRFIPDKQLLDLKADLQQMIDDKESKRK